MIFVAPKKNGLAARLKCSRVAETEVKLCLAQYGWKK